MNLAKHGPAAGYGALLGALGGFMLVDLGAPRILADTPPTWFVLIGLLFGAALGAIRAARWIGIADGVLVVVWLIIACTPLMDRLAPRWARHDALPAHADAVVVLSAGVESDTALSADGLDRLIAGLSIASSMHVGELVTSRIGRRTRDGVLTSDTDQARMVALAGYAGHWDVVRRVASTRDEAVRAAALLLPSRSRIVLVTSPMHTRRACATFEAVGFSVSCEPALDHQHATWHPETASDRIAAWRQYAYERLGMVKYRHKRWVTR